MNASASIYTDFNGLAALRAKAREQSPEARREVARQFEALFLQIMLKSMRQTSDAVGGGQSDQLKFYQQMFDQQVALELAGHRGIGLARVFERQLAAPQPRRDPALAMLARKPFAAEAASGASAMADAADVGPVREAADATWPPRDPADFLRRLWPAARDAAARLGVTPQVLLAQAALESGWGRRVPADSYNLFGIKADRRWQGERVSHATLEYRDGVAVRERAAFRSYRSPQESLRDYVDFIRDNPRYRSALEKAQQPLEYVRELQKAGYATDPHYARKVERILSSEVFTRAMRDLESG